MEYSLQTFTLTCLVHLARIYLSDAAECYSCQYTENAARMGYECVTSPERYKLGPPSVACPGECQTDRHITLASGTIYFLRRGCLEKTEGCETDMYGVRRTCVTACIGDLCNDLDLDLPTPPPTNASKIKLPRNKTQKKTQSRRVSGKAEEGYKCYSCVYSFHPEEIDSCVTDPANARPPNEVACGTGGKVCSVRRNWLKGEERIQSFFRGCVELDDRKDQCVDSAEFYDCETYCEREFCNDGSGIPPAFTTTTKRYPPSTTRVTGNYANHMSSHMPLCLVFVFLQLRCISSFF